MRGALVACALALMLAGGASAERAPSGPDMGVILAGQPAQTLSAYRLLSSATQPAIGVVAYDLGVPLFSDYAEKHRYMFTPPGQRARYRAGETFDFPVGSVLIKSFGYRDDANVFRPLETRLLIRKASGWSAAAYVWDADRREARLALAGAQLPVRFTDPSGAARDISYVVPNQNQCKGCHSVDDALSPIGPTVRNLDSQIVGLVAAGAVEAPPAATPIGRSLDQRARAYLDVNCAHCHNPRGPADNSGLDLRFDQHDPSHWGVRKRPVAAGRASAGLLFAIDPGHPENSILLHRMQSTDPGVMMPELGRTLVHREGVDLISRWIAAMDANGRVAEQN